MGNYSYNNMAQSKEVYRLSRLKDQRVDVKERLKLARKLWYTDDDVGPNKHQVIIDAIITVLINNKKRPELSEQLEQEVWQTLSMLLNGSGMTDTPGHHPTVSLRPTIAQVMVETLERERLAERAGETLEIVACVLDCCRCVLTSPSLAPVLTSRLDILVSLCSVLCHLAMSRPATDTCLPTVLSQVTTNLWHHHHRSQLLPSQVLQLVTDKLLEVVMALAFHVRQSQAGCPHATTAASLRDLVLTIMFHESHQKLIKAYLDNVIQPKKAAQVSRTVSNIFNTIAAPLRQKTVGEKKKLKGENLVHRDVVLCFLPLFFRHAVNAWKQRSQLSFQLFVCLASYLGVPADKEGGGQTSEVAMETDSVGVLRQLLSVVRERSVYNVAADRAEGEGQLQFFKRVLDVLLSAPLCEEQCGCLVELLALNHMILEPCLPALMSHCCPGLPQMDVGCRAGVDTWLSQVVSTYTQLHQLPRFYDAVLKMTAQSPQQLIHTLPLPAFAQSLCSAVTSLAHSTAVELWGRLHEEILSILQRVVDENHTDADMERLWASCLLFHQYLNNLRVSDWCKIASVGERIGGLISQLENSLVDPLLQVVQTNKSKSMLRAAALLLAVCLGDVKLTLADFRSSHITLPLPTTHQLPFSVQPRKLCRKKMKTDLEAVVRYLGDVLTTQRLRLLQVEGNDAAWLQQLSDITVWDDDDGHRQCHWDGQVCNVNINTYCVAKSHLLVCRSQSLLPPLIIHHTDQLAECVVHILSQPNLQRSSEHVRHTCRSVVRRLLKETSLMCLTSEERSKFQHQTVRRLWRCFFTSDCPLPSPTVAAVMKLADACFPGESDEAEELMSVMTSLEELLSPDVHTTLSDSQLALLQVLEELPLTTFTPASRRLCTVSLLVVLSHLDGRGVSGSDARGWDVAWGLLLGLLESSILRCLMPSTLLTCLKCLAAKSAASEDACVGQVLKKTVVMVMGDVDSLQHLEAFVAELERALKKMTRLVTKKKIDMNQSQHRSVLTLTLYIIKESHKHLRKDSSWKDVHSVYQQHFERLSSAVEEVVDAFEQQQMQFSLPPLLLQCFTAATAQRCIGSAQEREPLTAKQRQRIEFVLSTFCLGQKESQGISWQKEGLDFVACLYHHHNALPDLLTSPLTHTLWTSLLSSLHGNCATAEAEEGQWRLDVDDLRAQVRNHKRRLQEGDGDVHDKRRKLGDGCSRVVGRQNPKTPHTQGTGRREGEGEGEVVGKEDGGRGVGDQGASAEQEREKMMVDTMATVLASCRVALFTELLQEVVTSMGSGVRGSLLVWQRVVACSSLSVEQRKLLESFCLTVVEQCVQVMQKLHSCAHNEGEVMGAVPVLHCLTAMLNQHKLLSTKGTVLCLLCASLAPLSHGGYEQFLGVVRAVCDAVHAVLVHHPHTAHALIHVVLPIASSVMKECVRRGDQKVLLANPEHIRPMTSCAEQVHRLVTLLVSGGEVQRVVATLVSDYTTTVQSLTLLPEVKKWLVSSMYACLDACDQHAVRQLQQRLPPGVRDVLHMLHNDYVSYHKYTGKV